MAAALPHTGILPPAALSGLGALAGNFDHIAGVSKMVGEALSPLGGDGSVLAPRLPVALEFRRIAVRLGASRIAVRYRFVPPRKRGLAVLKEVFLVALHASTIAWRNASCPTSNVSCATRSMAR